MRGLLLLLIAALPGCITIPGAAQRQAVADDLAAAAGWRSAPVRAGSFELKAWLPAGPPRAELLTVYLEGDGFAWEGPSKASADPTPLDPLALRLALADRHGAVAYLARPCQYAAAGCPQAYWTEKRFAPEVVDATSAALDELKRRFEARRLVLVGYSGGGTLAALLAARRRDVARLVTVAGNLDVGGWVRHHGLVPLTGSLDPGADPAALRGIPQWHFVGGEDRVIPRSLTERFVAVQGAGAPARVVLEGSFDHRCCWSEHWPELLDAAGLRTDP